MSTLIYAVLAFLCLCLACVGYLLYWYVLGKSATIQCDGYRLRVRVYGRSDPTTSGPATIFFNGWSPGGAPWTPLHLIASQLGRRKHMLCLVVSLRGMGSQGDIRVLTRRDFLDDAVAAFDFLEKLQTIPSTGVYAVGESFGSYLACLLASRRPLAGLSLRVPTDFPAEGFADVPQIRYAGNLSRDWKSSVHSPSESPALGAVHDFRGPIQIISSERDQLIPPRTIQNYMQSISDPRQLSHHEMKRLGHALISPTKVSEYRRLLVAWLERVTRER
jgi:uncharacterized protein